MTVKLFYRIERTKLQDVKRRGIPWINAPFIDGSLYVAEQPWPVSSHFWNYDSDMWEGELEKSVLFSFEIDRSSILAHEHNFPTSLPHLRNIKCFLIPLTEIQRQASSFKFVEDFYLRFDDLSRREAYKQFIAQLITYTHPEQKTSFKAAQLQKLRKVQNARPKMERKFKTTDGQTFTGEATPLEYLVQEDVAEMQHFGLLATGHVASLFGNRNYLFAWLTAFGKQVHDVFSDRVVRDKYLPLSQ